MNEFYVTCVDNGTANDFFTIGKFYRVVGNSLYTNVELPIMVYYKDFGSGAEAARIATEYFKDVCGARFIAAERICDIDE